MSNLAHLSQSFFPSRAAYIIAFLVGATGLLCRCIPASSGVRLDFLRLQGLQADTMLSQELSPPRDRGITWSRDAFFELRWHPQYWQRLPSLRYTFRFDGDFERKNGTRTYSRRIMTDGNSKSPLVVFIL